MNEEKRYSTAEERRKNREKQESNPWIPETPEIDIGV